MSNEVLVLNQRKVRATDSNSLLRLYDQASEIVSRSLSQLDRIRAGKSVERLSKELKRRKIAF